MAREAHSVEEARTILNDAFNSKKNNHLAADREDFAKLLWFFSDNDEFENGLTELSKQLWDLYRNKDEDSTNKFSTSLTQYAMTAGFPAQQVTILAAGDENYPTYLKNGLLIKDEMDLLHGEYAHSLQWLAAHAARIRVNLAKSVGDLYKALGNIGMKSTADIWRYNKAEKKNDQGQVHLWAYLVDSFPMYMAKGLPNGNDVLSLFTETYRCPQNVTSWLLNLGDPRHFLARYLQQRYLNPNRNFMTRPYLGGPIKVSTGATVKNYAESRYANNPNYDKLEGGGGWQRKGVVTMDPPGHVPAQTAHPDKFTQVTFHGKTGWVKWDKY